MSSDDHRLDEQLASKLALRPVTDSDNDFLFSLYVSTRADEMALLPWDEAEKQAFLQQQFSAQSHHYQENYRAASFDVIEWQSESGQQRIGRLYVDRREDEIRIIDIALLPEYRGHGFGSYYLKLLLDEAAASQRCVTIHVEHNNPAMQLYKRLGFEYVHDAGVYWFMRWCVSESTDV